MRFSIVAGVFALTAALQAGAVVQVVSQPAPGNAGGANNAALSTATAGALKTVGSLNAIVMNNWTANNEIEGKVWVGGDVNPGQGKTQVGFGRSTAYSGQSGYGTLTVLGNLNTGIDLSNGPTRNGALGSYGATIGGNQTETNNGLNTKSNGAQIRIGGDARRLMLDGDGQNVMVNGQLNASGNSAFNATNTTVRAGSYLGNTNGLGSGSTVRISGANPNGNATPPAGWLFNQQQTLNAPTTASMSGDKTAMLGTMRDLSSTLSTLATTSTLRRYSDTGSSQYDLLFSVGSVTGRYAVFNVTAADLFGARGIGFDLGGSSVPIFINVTGLNGGTFNWNTNGGVTAGGYGGAVTWANSTDFDSQVLWNFSDATASSQLNLNTDWHGSILNPLGSVTNTGVIWGSAVVGNLNDLGEVHLGTFNAESLQAPLPEPATWAMMVIGFGAIGGVIRRRKAAIAIA